MHQKLIVILFIIGTKLQFKNKQMKGVFKEISFITISSFLGQLISLFLVLYVAKVLGPNDFGTLSYLISLTILFPVISGFGVPNAIFRFYNTISNEDKKEKKNVLSTGFFFVFTSSLLFSIITYLIIGFIKFDLILNYRFLFCLYGFTLSLTAILNIILRSKRDYKKTSFVSVSQPIIKSSIILFIIFFFKLSVSSILIANIISELFVFLYVIVNIEERIRINSFSYSRLIKFLRYGIAFLPHRIVTKGQDPLIKTFVLSIFGQDYVGMYALAQKINLPFSFIIDKIQFTWGPLKFDIKRKIKNPKYFFQKIAQSYISLISLATIVCIFSLLVFKSFGVFKLYYDVEYLTIILIVITFLRGNYYMYSTGIEFGKSMYMLPLSSTGYLFIIFISYNFVQFFHHSIFHLMIPIVFAELYSILLMRYYSKSMFFFKINFVTYFTTFLFALVCVIFCLKQNVLYFVALVIVSLISIYINRHSIKISKDLMASKL